ncbi:hypothetical protein NDU88_004145 [Pleurodeles waltl]|uniref:Uncharacterized protein n=1 Tax=Pleurodeles waltl TaxID=8319 RepID=A0AAV7NSW9_PLEWA|nr:hypothetical protein NDU88_004145 [Pleurodeles waltl]
MTTLKDNLKSCIREVQKEVTEVDERVDDLERTIDAREQDQKMVWRCMVTLEEQHIELQLKQEDLENRSRRNNVRIRGMPRDEEGADIMTYTAALLNAVRGDPSWPLPLLDRAHRMVTVPGRTNAAPDILARVYDYTEKEAIIQATQQSTGLELEGHWIQIYQDLSITTLRRRKDFKAVIDKLRTLNVKYQ